MASLIQRHSNRAAAELGDFACGLDFVDHAAPFWRFTKLRVNTPRAKWIACRADFLRPPEIFLLKMAAELKFPTFVRTGPHR